MTHEDSRQLKHYMKTSAPCNECISYAICQNRDIVKAVDSCKNLSISISKLSQTESGLSLILVTTTTRGICFFYVFNNGSYLGNFKGSGDQYYANYPM